MSEAVAVIDVGSNSIKLLVADSSPEGRINTLVTETVETRISGGISKELPKLQKDAMVRGVETIAELLRLAQKFNPIHTGIVATSAVRDAINGQDFIDAVEEATGIQMRVLSGTEEATYIGMGLACDPAIAGAEEFIQMDIGGGSLELIRQEKSQLGEVVSLRLGAVRISERFITDRETPIPRSAETAISAFVRAELTQTDFSFEPSTIPLIATGGAFVVSRAILAAKTGVTIHDYSATLKYSDLRALKKELCLLSMKERVDVPHLPAARADIIPTALITILALLRFAGRKEVTHSFYNLRYGIAAELLKEA